MAQVTSAVLACDLYSSHAKRVVLMPFNGPWDFVIEGGPATARVELILGLVKRSTASRTVVHSVVIELVVLPSAGSFSSLEPQNLVLLSSEKFLPHVIRRGFVELLACATRQSHVQKVLP